MVAVAQLIPKDPEEQKTVLGVLQEHPELQGFIARATKRARETFTDPEIHLDTVRYDEWGPPLRLIIRAPMPMPEHPEHNEELMLVFPQFAGSVDSGS